MGDKGQPCLVSRKISNSAVYRLYGFCLCSGISQEITDFVTEMSWWLEEMANRLCQRPFLCLDSEAS